MARIVEEIAKYFPVCPLCGESTMAVEGSTHLNGREWDKRNLLICKSCGAKWKLLCKRRNTEIKEAVLEVPGGSGRGESILRERIAPRHWRKMADRRQQVRLGDKKPRGDEGGTALPEVEFGVSPPDEAFAIKKKQDTPAHDHEDVQGASSKDLMQEIPKTVEKSSPKMESKNPNNSWPKFWGFLLQLLGLLGVIGAFAVSAPLFDRPGYAWMPLLLGGVLSGALIIAIGNMLTLQVGIADSLYRIEVELEETKEAIEKES